MAAQSGNGKHFAILSEDEMSGSILWTIVGFCPGVMSFGLPKLAVIFLLTRLMNPGKPHKILLWVMGIICNLGLVGCVVILFAQCTPVESQWDFSIQGECISKWVLVDYAIFAGGTLCSLSRTMTMNCQLTRAMSFSLVSVHGSLSRRISRRCALQPADSAPEEACSYWSVGHWLHVSEGLFCVIHRDRD